MCPDNMKQGINTIISSGLDSQGMRPESFLNILFFFFAFFFHVKKKGQTEQLMYQPTDRPTDTPSYRDARKHLKILDPNACSDNPT